MTGLAAAAADAHRGWGGPAAIVLAGLAFWVFVRVREEWLKRRNKIDNHSPTSGGRGGVRWKGLVREVSDSSVRGRDTGRRAAGRLVRLAGGAGSIYYPGDDEQAPDRDPDIDLDLDAEDDDGPPPADWRTFVRDELAGGAGYNATVKATVGGYPVSQRTVTRFIADLKREEAGR